MAIMDSFSAAVEYVDRYQFNIRSSIINRVWPRFDAIVFTQPMANICTDILVL